MKKRARVWVGVACAAAASAVLQPAAHAQARSAVMIEAGDQRLRDDLQWLADRGILHMSTSAWPMPLSAIEDALAERRPRYLSAADLQALQSVEREVARLRAPVSFGVGLGVETARVPPTSFESPVRARADVSAWAAASRGAFAGRLEVHGLDQPLTERQASGNLQGSYVATQFWGQVLYAGQLEHWWGPGQDGSLVWSNAALPIPGIALRRGSERAFRSPLLRWMGPWGYEIFLGRMMHNAFVPGVRAFGMRVHMKPTPRFELGASRMIHYGGTVGDNGLGALWDAFRGVGSNQDIAGGKGVKSNEIAGFDARYTWLPGGNPLSLYGQFIGEDEAGGLPSKYMGLAGLQYKREWGRSRVQMHIETADTVVRRLWVRNGDVGTAYQHHLFQDGMYHEGLPIGHFMGGDGQSVTVGASVVPLDNMYRLRYQVRLTHARVNPLGQAINMAFPNPDNVTIGEVAASWEMRMFDSKPMKLRVGVVGERSHRNGNDAGLSLRMELPL